MDSGEVEESGKRGERTRETRREGGGARQAPVRVTFTEEVRSGKRDDGDGGKGARMAGSERKHKDTAARTMSHMQGWGEGRAVALVGLGEEGE
jgi:hypothetical protein